MNRRILLYFLTLFILVLVPMMSLAQDNSTDTTPTIIHDTINNEIPFHSYSIQIPNNNTTITLDLEALDGTLDTLLYLTDAQGQILAENDDRADGDYNSRLIFPSAEAGIYFAIATRYNVDDGSTDGNFELEIQLSDTAELTIHDFDVSKETLVDAGFPEIEQREVAQWTIIAYYGGDTNLEAGILTDLNEFELAGGSSDSVRIVALVDRHPEYSDASGDWAGARIYEITADTSDDSGEHQTPTIDSEPLAILDSFDSGEGENFARFLVWAISNFPAEHYTIAIASHGAAWRGIIVDETDTETQLSLPELNQAYELARSAAGIERFDLLINDACLMSSVEYHSEMSRYFNYSIASPEIVVNPALDMTLFSRALKEDGNLDIEMLGIELVDTYITRDVLEQSGSIGVFLTNSISDLSAFNEVQQAIEDFASVVNNNPALYASFIGQIRANTYTYTSFARGDDLIDLGDFMSRIAQESDYVELRLAAIDVLNALDNVIVYGNAGERALQNTSAYHNIYFPSDSRSFDEKYLIEGDLTEWGNMLRNFYNAVTPRVWSVGDDDIAFHPPSIPKLRIYSVFPTESVSTLTPIAFSIEIIGRNFAYGEATFDHIQPDGTAIRYETNRLFSRILREDGTIEFVNNWQPGANLREIQWDIKSPVLSDGVINNNEYFIVNDVVASLEGRYQEPNSENWSEVSVIFDRAGTLERVISRTGETNSVGVIEILTGSTFQTYRFIVTLDGRVIKELGNIYTWPESGPTWSYQPAPSGDYNVGLVVTSHGGTTGFTSTTISVDNSNVDPNLAAYTRISRGFSFPVPSDWQPAAVIGSDTYRSLSPDGSRNISAYYVLGDIEDDLESIINLFTESHSFVLEEGREFVSFSTGKQGLVFDYTYETDEGTVYGRGISGFSAGTRRNVGLILAAESSNSWDDLAMSFDLVLNQSRVFDIAIIEETNTRQWAILTGNFSLPNVAYPIFRSWYANITEEGSIWHRHGENRDAEAVNRAAVAIVEEPLAEAQAQLNLLFEENVSNSRANAEIVAERLLIGVNHDWTAIIYTAERDGVAVSGRMYVTYANDKAYVAWFEILQDENTQSIYADLLEPMVDGFRISAPEEE